MRASSSCCWGVKLPWTAADWGRKTPSSPSRQVTWAVHAAPIWAALSTIYAANSCSMMDFSAVFRSSSSSWVWTAAWA